jgi:hypothetical protein
MRRIGGLLLLFALVVSATEAHGQLFLPSPYGFGGGFQFSYSRGSLGRGLRLGVGGQLYGLAGPYYPSAHSRITVVSIAAPPQVIYLPAPPAEEMRPPTMPRLVEPPAPAPPAPKKEEPKAKPEKPPAELRAPPGPKEDPDEEHDRQVRLGRETFKAQEYGRSAQRFRQAIRLRPGEGLPYFLLAQSLIAQGKYHEAQEAVPAGLERWPDWPTSGFRPLELYEAPVEYTEQLRALEELVARHPRDPVILFVCGYALWFDGRRDEAGRLFQRALERAKDRGPIERFLKALPAGEKL